MRSRLLQVIGDCHRQLLRHRNSYYSFDLSPDPWKDTREFLHTWAQSYELHFRHLLWLCHLGETQQISKDIFLGYEKALCRCVEMIFDGDNSPRTEEFLQYASILKTLPFDWVDTFQVVHSSDESFVGKDPRALSWDFWSQTRPTCRLNRGALRNCFQSVNRPAAVPGCELPAHKLIRERLEEFYGLKQEYSEGIAGIHLRPMPLIVGPSGLGKTHAVKAWAETRGLPMLSLQSGSWNVTGARQTPYTVTMVQTFLRSCDGRGVVFFDELDKFSCLNSDWSRGVLQEVYALLDNRVESIPNWSGEDGALLKKAFLVGAGTWQADFNHGWGKTSSREILESQSAVPQELLYRFNERIILLDHLAGEDYRCFLEYFYRTVLKEQPNRREIASLCEEAVASRRNFRWIEAFVAAHATAMLEVKRAQIPEHLQSLADGDHTAR